MKMKIFLPLAAAALGLGAVSGYAVMTVADPSPSIITPRPAVTVTKSTVKLLPGPSTTVTIGGADIPGVVTPYSSPVYHVTHSASPRAARSPEPARAAPSPSPSPEADLSPVQSPSPVVTFTPSSAPVLGVLG